MSWKTISNEISNRISSSSTENQEYDIIGKLDSGGMGKVYLAVKKGPLDTKQLVVLKVPLATQNRDKWRAEFEDEARITSHLNHPNIVRIIDWTELQNQPCIVSEYIEGFDLRQVINFYNDQHRQIPNYVTAQIMIQACEAMQYIHNAKTIDDEPLNIVHRDIDPSNIMISDNGYIKIIDFGISKNEVQGELTKPGVYKGKFTYLSPDVFLPEKIDQRADIFSLGLVLFELLTGEKPRYFSKQQSLSDIIRSIKETKIPAPSDVVPGIPYSFDRIVAKATSLDKNDRYLSVKDMLADILKLSKKLQTGADHSFIKRWICHHLSPLRERRMMKMDAIKEVHLNTKRPNMITAIQSQTIINPPTFTKKTRKLDGLTKQGAFPLQPWWINGIPGIGLVLGLNTILVLGGFGILQKNIPVATVPVIVKNNNSSPAAEVVNVPMVTQLLLQTETSNTRLDKPKLGRQMPYRPYAMTGRDPLVIERWNTQWKKKLAKKKKFKQNRSTRNAKKTRVKITKRKLTTGKSKRRRNKGVQWTKRKQ